MQIETIMDKLEDYLKESTLHLIISIEEEDYELAAEIRDDIDDKLYTIQEMILRNNLTKLNPFELWNQLEIRKDFYLKDWYETLNIPNDRRVSQK
jgi:hypothetical protein